MNPKKVGFATANQQVGSISPRVKPLREKGLLRWTGKRRPGCSNRMQRVWECVPGTENIDPASIKLDKKRKWEPPIWEED
jgi:hypothetical protein